MTTDLNAALLTPEAERRIRRAATAFVVFVALASAVLSFSGLHELALRAGFHPYIAALFPLATDVAVAAFSLTVLQDSLTGLRTWYAWLCMLLCVGVSVAGNVYAAPDDIVARLVHAWPPIVFALSFEALARLHRHRIDVTHRSPKAPEPVSISVTPAHREPRTAATQANVPSSNTTDPPLGAPERTVEPPARQALEAPASPAPVAAEDEPTTAPVTVNQPEPALASPTPTHEAPATSHVPAADTPPAVSASPAPTRRRATANASTGKQTLRERIVTLLENEPTLTQAEVARRMNADPSNVSKVVKRLRSDRPDLFPADTPALSALDGAEQRAAAALTN